MPSAPRSETIDQENVGVYHVWNRLVQRRHLLGVDFFTNRDLSYRKDWVRDRIRELSGCFAIDLLDYAILENHVHLVLRNRPDIVETWSDEEVVMRWWFVCPLRKNKDGTIPDPKPCEIGLLMPYVAEYRKRLSDISWLMRLTCQPIARRANQEDGVDGRFFAKRFDCKRLDTEVDILNCSLYVDLNWIHAGMALTPEQSEFTSACERIQARWREVQEEMGQSTSESLDGPAAKSASPKTRDASWLAPIFLDERSEAYVGASSVATSEHGERDDQPFYNPIRSPRVSNKGFLPITLDEYLSLLDTAGRVVRGGKRGVIPKDLPPILQRLGLEPTRWIDSFMDLFSTRSAPQPCPWPG
jgi:hypothetical protein